MVLELYAKVYVKMAKIRLQKKCDNFVINKDSSVKFDTTIIRPVPMLCKSLKFVSSNIFEKYGVKERHGRAGSGRAGSL